MSTAQSPAPSSAPSPAELRSTPVDGVEVLGALSPSRASDFMTCPLLYRYRTIDRLPEEPSVDALRGTLVHKVLEDLFDLPSQTRTPDRARDLLVPTWEALLETEPELAELFADEGRDVAEWLASCRSVLDRYFTLEDPRRLEPAERELYVETLLDSKLLLRGFIDRLDVAPDGAIRVVDYKGLALDTPLPTPRGWATMGDVRVGDAVLGADGNPTLVTHKSSVHHRPCYRVGFLDGSSVVCDNVHQWTVVKSRRQVRSTVTVDTEQLSHLHRQQVLAGRPHSLWIEASAPLTLPAVADLPIEPWLLGAWLGDGDNRSGRLTVGRADIDDMLTLVKQHWPRDVRVRAESTAISVCAAKTEGFCGHGHPLDREPTPAVPTRRCRETKRHDGPRFNVGLTTELQRMGLRNDKHIPHDYLRAAHEQRVELLRGLMDTDGWWSKARRRAGFTTTNDRLAADVVELLRTLGITALHFRKPYTNAVRSDRTWHVIEFTPIGFNPFSLPRKAVLCQVQHDGLRHDLAKRRIIVSVEPVESVPTQCISVDSPDSLYLCGQGFIPTHNTGRSVPEWFEAKALFQMKFYALVVWRTRGVVPAMLQLVYLGNGEMLRYVPDESDLLATERKVEAIWSAIKRAQESGDWRPNRSKLCDWCSFQELCPEFGGTPPPLPSSVPTSPVSG